MVRLLRIYTHFFMLFAMIVPSYGQNKESNPILSYVHDVLYKYRDESSSKDPSISLINNASEPDKSYIKSISDAFLWSSGIQTKLLIGRRARLNLVYLESFETVEKLTFPDATMLRAYEEQFAVIKNGGPCTSMKVNTSSPESNFSIVFLDKNSSDEDRATCIYRHYRALFGINESENMPTWNDTFIADLRIIKCRSTENSPEKIIDSFRSGKC